MSDIQATTRRLKRVALGERIARNPLIIVDLLHSLHVDIEGMRNPRWDSKFGEHTGDDEKAFGPFSVAAFDAEGDAIVSWPNLAIMGAKLADLLK